MNAAEFGKISRNTEAKAQRWAAYLRSVWDRMSDDARGDMTVAEAVERMTPEAWERVRHAMRERAVPNLSKARILEVLKGE